jgi:ribosome-associated protein
LFTQFCTKAIMNIDQLQHVVVNALENVKGQTILAFDSTKLTELFDRVIIASGTSNRQTRALAISVLEEVKKAGGKVVSMEGDDTGEWVLVDCGDLICHIMQPAIRTYYNLEELWGQFPVALHPVSMKKAPAKKAPAKKAPSTKVSTTKTPARKASAAKPANAKVTTTKTGSTKAVPAKAAAKKPAAKTPAAKKPAAKKPAAKKAAAKKSSTSKKASSE